MVAKVLTWDSNPNPVRTLDPSDESVAAMSPSASLLWITGHIGGEDTAATVTQGNKANRRRTANIVRRYRVPSHSSVLPNVDSRTLRNAA